MGNERLTMSAAAPQGFAGTYGIEVRPVRQGDEHGTLSLHGTPEVEGVICYCRTEVAEYALALIDCEETPTVTLDHHGNVVSVQTAAGTNRVEFPKAA
jgi:hypothetical protein